MTETPPDDAPEGRASPSAEQRLRAGLRAELDRVRMAWTANLIGGDAALDEGDHATARRTVDDQQELLDDLHQQLDRLVAAAAVERRTEAELLARRPVALPGPTAPPAPLPARQPAPAPVERATPRPVRRWHGGLVGVAVSGALALVVVVGAPSVTLPEVDPVEPAAQVTSAADEVAPAPEPAPGALASPPSARDGWLAHLDGTARPDAPAPAPAPSPTPDPQPEPSEADAGAPPASDDADPPPVEPERDPAPEPSEAAPSDPARPLLPDLGRLPDLRTPDQRLDNPDAEEPTGLLGPLLDGLRPG